jgi:hypothetical protein
MFLILKYIDGYKRKEESDEQELTGFKRCFRQVLCFKAIYVLRIKHNI